jgi:UDP-glucuronate 4-epimerase
MKVLVTGAAGFIGMHVAARLLARGDQVVGIDNLNDYYDVGLKRARVAELEKQKNFHFEKRDIVDAAGLQALLREGGFERVVHLAAQAGVRYSLQNPAAYVQSNIVGFLNLLEACRAHPVQHLVYASSSSVYGGNKRMPFSETDNVDHPISVYAATKKANELMAHSYSHLHGQPATGLRFFTVYGPWGRPDMALFLFTRAILEGKPIKVFNHGRMQRDFTYIDDIAEGVLRVLDKPPAGPVPHQLFNIGNHQPVELMQFIGLLEARLGRKAEKQLLPIQDGDVPATYADVSALEKWTGFRPTTAVAEGIERFVSWYRGYYRA